MIQVKLCAYGYTMEIRLNESLDHSIYIGIDEAGRGPLIGDMVIAGIMTTNYILDRLVKKGLRDSKRLNPTKRYFLYNEAVREGVATIAVFIHPWRIDRENLNLIEERYIKWILKTINTLINDLKMEKVYIFVDEVKGCNNNVRAYAEELFKEFKLSFSMEANADLKYPPVALASVIAKVARDTSINALKRHIGDFGSGYTADPTLKDWLESSYSINAPPPIYIRRSWRLLKHKTPLWYIAKRKRKTPMHKNLRPFTKR
ncbi:MAG: ribonuclease HII [Desulfurococcaceae archaeon]